MRNVGSIARQDFRYGCTVGTCTYLSRVLPLSSQVKSIQHASNHFVHQTYKSNCAHPMDTFRDGVPEALASSQKTMLSKALQKANTAVLLDNAANYEGAIEAYLDACDLLSHVMYRADGEEKHKLEDIVSVFAGTHLAFMLQT